jgi:hypothetical protein
MATSPASAQLQLSPSSTASYDLVSSLSGSLSVDVTSDDEVIWLPHRSSDSSSESSIHYDTDDDDFVVLSRPRSPPRNTRIASDGFTRPEDEISSAISALSLPAPDKSSAKGISTKVSVSNTPQSSPLNVGLSKKQKKKKKVHKRAKKVAKAAQAGSTTFPVVDDAYSDTNSNVTTSTVVGYEDASSFITS